MFLRYNVIKSYKFLVLYREIEISNFFYSRKTETVTFNIFSKLKFWLALLKKIFFLFLSFSKTKVLEQLRKKIVILSRNKVFSKIYKKYCKNIFILA